MDNGRGPLRSGFYINKPTKPVLIDPCKTCLVQACCTKLCLKRIDFFKTEVWREYDQEKNEK